MAAVTFAPASKGRDRGKTTDHLAARAARIIVKSSFSFPFPFHCVSCFGCATSRQHVPPYSQAFKPLRPRSTIWLGTHLIMLAFFRLMKAASQHNGEPLLGTVITSIILLITSLHWLCPISAFLRSFQASPRDHSRSTRWHVLDFCGLFLLQCCLHLCCD